MGFEPQHAKVFFVTFTFLFSYTSSCFSYSLTSPLITHYVYIKHFWLWLVVNPGDSKIINKIWECTAKCSLKFCTVQTWGACVCIWYTGFCRAHTRILPQKILRSKCLLSCSSWMCLREMRQVHSGPTVFRCIFSRLVLAEMLGSC